MFVGRTRELELLHQEWSAGRSSLVPIYGRRRVGKSELILRFIAEKPSLYFVGKQAPAALQRAEFLRQAAAVLGEPLLESYPAGSWAEALAQVEERWKGSGPFLLVLDEFQWMVEQSPELPSVLQELWDRQWKKGGRIFLILCGSYVGFMEREVLAKKSPLFGRRTAQILLRPFDYLEAGKFFPRWSIEQRALAYFVVGGVPWYLSLFDADASFEMNLRALLFNEFAPLFREPDFLLREELRDTTIYYGVLLALAAGSWRTADIAQRANLPERSLHYYLQQLTELGYVQKRLPLSGMRAAQRHVRYVLEDPLLRFWFRFLFPNQSQLAQAGAAHVYRERVKPELDAYFGICFERLCREALPKLYVKEGVNASFEIGEYWDKLLQVDVVGLRADGVVDLAECKWGSVRSRRQLEADLLVRAEHFPNPRNATIALRVFAQAPSKASGEARWHSLSDLYAL